MRKYPRTPHLPWSPGATKDDKRLESIVSFVGCRVVVSEKMDGECTTIHSGGCHARSLDSKAHPSRTRVRALADRFRHELPEGWNIVGENLYARHSIHYRALPDYFLGFGLHLDGQFPTCMSWLDTEAYLVDVFGLHLVPVLYRGPWDEKAVRGCFTGISRCGGEQEGYVVRLEDSFDLQDFGSSVAKYVRAGHVTTDEHWLSKPVVPNLLASC